MADSQELEPQLNAFARETLQHRDAVINAGVENIAKANMVNRIEPSNVSSLDAYRAQKQALAQMATNNAVNDYQEPLSA